MSNFSHFALPPLSLLTKPGEYYHEDTSNTSPDTNIPDAAAFDLALHRRGIYIPESLHGKILRGSWAGSGQSIDEQSGYMDVLFQQHLSSLAARPSSGILNIRASALLSRLRKLCNELDKLPSVLYLDDIQLADGRWPPRAIGGGSFSDVYTANKGNLVVAVKVLRAHQHDDEHKLKRSFISEALIWASCQHKFVLPFLGVDTNNFSHEMCMVLPWMKNGKVLNALKSLREANNPRAGQVQVDKWIYQISQGLAYLHSLGIIHGDLRAANVLVDEHYDIRLSDFGLSLIADDFNTQATTIERTPNWIAPELLDPEQFGGHSGKPTLAGDIYAFGCVTIELYTGNPPYAGLQPYQVIREVMGQKPIYQPAFYELGLMCNSMWALIQECLSHDPSLRPSGLNIPEALENCLYKWGYFAYANFLEW